MAYGSLVRKKTIIRPGVVVFNSHNAPNDNTTIKKCDMLCHKDTYFQNQNTKDLLNVLNEVENKLSYKQDINIDHYELCSKTCFSNKDCKKLKVKEDVITESDYSRTLKTKLYIDTEVCMHTTEKQNIIKYFKLKKDDTYISSLFTVMLEIAFQLLIYGIINSSNPPTALKNTIVPKIINYYKKEITEDGQEFVIVIVISEFLENMDLDFSYYNEMKSVFTYLEQQLGIYHNDTHSDNIKKSKDNKIILFDWGRASFESSPATKNGFITNNTAIIHVENKEEDFKKWLTKTLTKINNNKKLQIGGGKTLKTKIKKLKTNKSKSKNKTVKLKK